ncbi:mCG144961, isoform CRA_a, partial [Mus musculus]
GLICSLVTLNLYHCGEHAVKTGNLSLHRACSLNSIIGKRFREQYEHLQRRKSSLMNVWCDFFLNSAVILFFYKENRTINSSW